MLLAVEVAETLAEHASLWAIRVALLAMVVTFVLQLRGLAELSNVVRGTWLVGATAAIAHSALALLAFHDGSHAAAFESTAQQTEELLGVAVGVGLYVNYIFVAVWLVDAALRCFRANLYRQLPYRYRVAMYSFLIFIAFNGTVVFKDGWLRMLGLIVTAILLLMYWRIARKPSGY
jgi:hypothetical protein